MKTASEHGVTRLDWHETGAVGEISVVEPHPHALVVGVLIDVIDAFGVEARGASNDPMDLVALVEQELRKVAPVLSGDAGDQGTS